MNPGQERAQEAAQFVRRIWSTRPEFGLILGTGLGGLASQIECDAEIPFSAIPGFPRSTALSHVGRLVCGTLADCPVVAMQGRCHLYEGYSRGQIGLPVRTMDALGVKALIISSASGGLNPQLRSGDILVLEGHVDLMTRMPESDAESEPGHGCTAVSAIECRLPSPYDDTMRSNALAVARGTGFTARRGVYVGVTGPNYETRAEYRMLRRLGDVVGMSTVPEVLVAAECGLRVLALSVVTNVARPDALASTTADEVVDLAARTEPKLRTIVLDQLARNRDLSDDAIDD